MVFLFSFIFFYFLLFSFYFLLFLNGRPIGIVGLTDIVEHPPDGRVCLRIRHPCCPLLSLAGAPAAHIGSIRRTLGGERLDSVVDCDIKIDRHLGGLRGICLHPIGGAGLLVDSIAILATVNSLCLVVASPLKIHVNHLAQHGVVASHFDGVCVLVLLYCLLCGL